MASFTKWLLDHKVAVICVLVLLMALSVVGTILTDKESDVLSYLDPESDTSIGKQMLNEQYGIVGDTTIGISYLSREDIQRIVTFVDGTASDGAYNGMDENDIPTQSRAFSKTVEGKPLLSRNVVWIGSFDDLQEDGDLQLLLGIGGVLDVVQSDLDAMRAKFQDKFVKETDGETTYILNIYFSQSGSNNAVINALDALEKEIQRILNERIEDGTITQIDDASQGYYFSGMAQNARILVDSSLNDMPKFVIAAVLVVFVILLLSSHSYLEPFIFLATLGISILLNMGTNVIAGNPIGTISTITSSCAVILQLAVAMDYSIFLSHSFQEELRTLKDPKIALMHAMPKTLKSILASALTTVGGFVALFFMNYGIGYDLGFVLAKGVILSLLAVIFIQPILLILTKKLIDKTHHNWIVTPRLNFVGKTITNKWVSVIVIVLCVAIAVPSAYFQGLVPLNYITFTNETPEEEKSLAQREVEGTNNQLILVIPYQYDGYGNIDLSKHYEFIDKIQQVGVTDETAPTTDFVEGDYVRKDGNKFNPVSDVFTLASIVGPDLLDTLQDSGLNALADSWFKLNQNDTTLKEQLNGQLFGSFISNVDDETEGSVHYMLYTINLEGDPEDIESYNTMLRIRDIANEMFDVDASGNRVYVTGLAQGAYDLFTVTPDDFTLVNILSAVIVFLVLLLTFRRPIMSVVLLLVIEAGIFANLTLAYLIGDKINFMAYLIVSAIELGATVDYAILFSSKYFEEKENCTGVVAVKNAVHRSAPSVITSASILIFTCVAVTLLTTNPIVGQITRLIAIGTCFSLILVFTLLPSILNIKERVSRWYSIKKGKGDPDEGKDNVPIYEKKRQAKLEAKKLAMASVGADGDSVMIDADAGDGVKASDVLIDRGDEPKPAETGDGGDADGKTADDKADDEVMTTSDDDKK